MKHDITDAGLKWLEAVLSNRFGQSWCLRWTFEGLVLTLNNSQGRLLFDKPQIEFSLAGFDLGCTLWDPEREGWHSALGEPLSAPGAKTLPSPLVEQKGTDYVVHYDILGLVYWMLTRQEEVGRTDLDNHGRFPATASHAYKHDYLERPIVDEWLHILGQVIQHAWLGLELKQNRFSVKVSHDVDNASSYAFRSWFSIARAMVGNLIKRGDVAGALRAPWIRLNSEQMLHPADPANTFEWLMDVSEKHGLTSSFYFICGRTDPRLDADYEPEHPAVRHLMRRIHQRGHEIGLHPSYNTYQNPAAIVAEARRLRTLAQSEGIQQPEWGGRMHFLRWEHPSTLRSLDEAGLDYDSTLSYADRPGFRCGTCFEYPAFDPVAKQMLRLRIRPLIAMECTVMAPRHMGLGTGEQAYTKFMQLKGACKSVGGCFTLLWHNSQFSLGEERALYQNVLAR